MAKTRVQSLAAKAFKGFQWVGYLVVLLYVYAAKFRLAVYSQALVRHRVKISKPNAARGFWT